MLRAIRLLRCQRGSQAIEFIGILPLFLLMILIVWQFALVAITAVTAKEAAMEGARAAMVEEAGDSGYETAVRSVASPYDPVATKSEFGSGGNTYVTVKVTLKAPLLANNQLFDTSGLELPVSSQVTVRKEKIKE
jgi:Flp pilus assembly protein TadG